MPQLIKLKTILPASSKGYREKRKVRPAFQANLEVVIDWHLLSRELSKRAADNKTGKATLLGGIVKARITNKVPDYEDAPD